MAKNRAAGLLTSVDELFATQTERDEAKRSYVTDLPAAEISDFPSHPFKVRMDEEMERLLSSGITSLFLSLRRNNTVMPLPRLTA